MYKREIGRFGLPSVLACGLLLVALGAPASAQTPSPLTPGGWNAVINSGSNPYSPTYAIVDVTQYGTAGTDVCALINNVFGTYNLFSGTTGNFISSGVVIDARGATTLNCQSGVNPWANLLSNENANQYQNFSNTVLLPAGIITINTTWTLPNWTHLVGEGPNTTIIRAGSSLSSGSDIIDVGSEVPSDYCGSTVGDCPAIVIEHLGINVGGPSILGKGIVNCCAQELSRVNDVAISNVATGLALTDISAENSGPYTNLLISNVSKCLSIGPATTIIQPYAPTMINSRGVHGLTCLPVASSTAAITIDGPNNTLEDVTIIGLSKATDGILIGSQGVASGNTLVNVSGKMLNYVIHIKNPTITNAPLNCPSSSSTGPYFTVCDLTMFGVAGTNMNGTIKDDLTGSLVSDSTVAMYTLGEIVVSGSGPTNIGYSRYTTATVAGTATTPWLVGTSSPVGTTCTVGALYSCTGTSSSCPSALYECGGNKGWLKVTIQ